MSLAAASALQLLRLAMATRAEGPQVIIGVNTRAVAVMPVHLDCVISHRANFDQFCVGDIDESSLRAMSLTKRTGTVTPEIRFGILADMPVVPSNAHRAARSNMVDLGGDWICHQRF